MEHDKFCPEHALPVAIRYPAGPCLQCKAIRNARTEERKEAAWRVGTLRASAKKDENGWALYEHCYECSGAADGYDTAIDDALSAIRGDGEQA